MAGYMGFGMARWIYTQRPKKAFSKGRSKPSCNTLPTYSRTFKLQPSLKSSRLYIIMSLLLIGLLFFSVHSKSSELIAYTERIEAQKRDRIVQMDNSAYQFLMRSGISRLQTNNILGAYSEFKLAFDIYPYNEQLNQLLIETLNILCDRDKNYCDELDTMLSKSL